MWATLAAWAGGAWARIAFYGLAVASVVAVVASIYRKGEKAAEAAQEARQRAVTIKGMKERADVETEVLRRPDGDAANELRDRWSRD